MTSTELEDLGLVRDSLRPVSQFQKAPQCQLSGWPPHEQQQSWVKYAAVINYNTIQSKIQPTPLAMLACHHNHVVFWDKLDKIHHLPCKALYLDAYFAFLAFSFQVISIQICIPVQCIVNGLRSFRVVDIFKESYIKLTEQF